MADLSKLGAGPWNASGATLTREEVLAVLAAMPDTAAMCKALGVKSLTSTRKPDRALALLKRAGLAKYVNRQWNRIE